MYRTHLMVISGWFIGFTTLILNQTRNETRNDKANLPDSSPTRDPDPEYPE